MRKKIAINGFGRMGRLALRAAWNFDFDIVHINELYGDVHTAAHLLCFDSIHGKWEKEVTVANNSLIIDGKKVSYSRNNAITETNWKSYDVDIVVECTGKHKSSNCLQAYLKSGVKKVVVSCPVKDGALNVVMGVNDALYDHSQHDIVTAASCTTNCLAPVVKIIHEQFGIIHGSITTIHNFTNTQSILDTPHKDLRRARASSLSLIPTSTGSATAIGLIFPELQGKLDGIAVRVPIANASLTDCVFEVGNPVTVNQVNTALRQASEHELKNILGYEERPLVSVDYTNDKRSGIIDALSTRVINGTQVKVLAWYDNEIGYVNRMMELVNKVAQYL